MADDSDIRQVIVMRNDLGMRKGKMIAQGAHASMKVLLDRLEGVSPANGPGRNHANLVIGVTMPMLLWTQGLFTKICVRVSSEVQLLEIYEKGQEAQLPCALIQDAGLTEFKEPTYTCCAVGPAPKWMLDPITGHLKLL